MKQKAIAKYLNVSAAYVCMMENLKVPISFDIYNKWVNIIS